MARCVKSEKMGRPIFYGAMITEGVVALIWATVASWFFYAPTPGYELIAGADKDFYTSAPAVVNLVCNIHNRNVYYLSGPFLPFYISYRAGKKPA